MPMDELPMDELPMEEEIRDWIRRTAPEETPSGLDRRVLEAARAELARRRRRRTLLRLAPLVAAAVVLIAIGRAVLAPNATPDAESDPASDRSVARTLSRTTILRVEGRGRFEVEAGSRIVHAPGSVRLELFAGRAAVDVERDSLEIAFPGDGVAVIRGRASVEVLETGEPAMKKLIASLGLGAVVTAATVAVVTVVLDDGDGEVTTPNARRDLTANEPVVFAARPQRAEEVTPPAPEPATPEEKLVAHFENLDLTVVKGEVAFAGRVVDDPTGEPIAGASVEAIAWRGSHRPAMAHHGDSADAVQELPYVAHGAYETLAAVTTEEDGTFAVTNPKSGWFLITAPDHGPKVVLLQDSLEAFEARLGPLTTLRGLLVNEAGRAVRGAPDLSRVHALVDRPGVDRPADGPSGSPIRVPVQEGASFTIDFDGIRSVTLQAESQGFQPLEQEILLVPGVQEQRLFLVSSRFLAGRVVDGRGEPIAGATIELRERRREGFEWKEPVLAKVESGEDGYYRVSAAEGDLLLRAEAPGFRMTRIEHPPLDVEPYDIRLERYEPGSLSGRVISAAGPLGAIALEAHREDGLLDPVVATVSDEEGRFLFEELRPGFYRLRASRVMKAPAVDGTVTFGILRSLTAAESLSSNVVFRFGPDSLEIEAGPFEVLGGLETSGVEVVFPLGARIRGVVRTEQGAPKSRSAIRLRRYDPETGKTRRVASGSTDEEGRFEFSGVPEGTYELVSAPQVIRLLTGNATFGSGETISLTIHPAGEGEIVREDARKQSLWVTVRDGETVDVAFEWAEASLRGRVPEDFFPGERRSVTLVRLGDDVRATYRKNVDEDGAFHAEGMVPGTYFARVSAQGRGHALVFVVDVPGPESRRELVSPSGSIRGRAPAAVRAGTEVHVRVLEMRGFDLQDRVSRPGRTVAIVGIGPGGGFTVGQLAPGRYRVEARDGGSVWSDEVDVAGGPTGADLR